MIYFFTLKIWESNIMRQEKAGELTHDLQVMEAGTAFSPNFTLREGKKTRMYFQSSGLHRVMYSF